MSTSRQPRSPRRFAGCEVAAVGGVSVPVATSRLSRLIGLAWLDRSQAGPGLLIPRCRSVHSLGMRFPLEVVFLDERLRPVGRPRRMAPRRLASERRAAAVLELPAPDPRGAGDAS